MAVRILLYTVDYPETLDLFSNTQNIPYRTTITLNVKIILLAPE